MFFGPFWKGQINYGFWGPLDFTFNQAHRRLAKEVLSRCTEASCSTILEIGCGSGWLLKSIKNDYPTKDLTGVDPHYLGKEVRDVPILKEEFENAFLKNAYYSLAISIEQLYLVEDSVSFFKKVNQVLIPNTGRFLGYTYCATTLDSELLETWKNAFQIKYLPTVYELRIDLERAGFYNPKLLDYSTKVRRGSARFAFMAKMARLLPKMVLQKINISSTHLEGLIDQYKLLKNKDWAYIAIYATNGSDKSAGSLPDD